MGICGSISYWIFQLFAIVYRLQLLRTKSSKASKHFIHPKLACDQIQMQLYLSLTRKVKKLPLRLHSQNHSCFFFQCFILQKFLLTPKVRKRFQCVACHSCTIFLLQGIISWVLKVGDVSVQMLSSFLVLEVLSRNRLIACGFINHFFYWSSNHYGMLPFPISRIPLQRSTLSPTAGPRPSSPQFP